MPDSKLTLSVTEVAKTYRQGHRSVAALAGVSLQIPDGRFLAIMGASGSGKSTLLHLMGGLTRPDRGVVRVGGTELGSLTDRQLTLFRRRNIGLVFQAFNLIPTLSARENVALPLLLEGTPKREVETKVERLLHALGLQHRREHRPDALSGGEQQRVAIGRALANEPSVILADEPTGNLDSVNGRTVCELLRDLARTQGKTVVIVTHEPTVAAYAQEVVVLRDGRLVGRFDNESGADAESLALRYQECLRESAADPAAPAVAPVPH